MPKTEATPSLAVEVATIEAKLDARLDAAVSSRAIPGDAMALTPAERLVVQALIINDLTPFAGADIAAILADTATIAWGDITAIKTETDKWPGADVDTESAALNIGAGEVTLFTIATATRIEILGAFCSMAGTTPVTVGATITVRAYLVVNGVEVLLKEETYVKGTDPDGIIILDSTIGVTGNFRVTLQSDNAGDNATTVPYQYVIRTMET